MSAPMFELLYHSAMPGWVKVRGLIIRPVPECEGGGYKIPKEQGELTAAAPELAEALREALDVLCWTACEEQLPEGACELETPENCCDLCRAHGCLPDKITRARAALAKAGA